MINLKNPDENNQMKFLQHPAVNKLKELARQPFDLTQEGNLSAKRVEEFASEACGFRFLYGTERVTKEVMQGLVELADQAGVHEKMRAMQAGEVINRIEGFASEERAVLHTATRDFFENPQSSKVALKASQQAKKEVDKLRTFIEKITLNQTFTDMVCIGIGGSDLGPRAHYIALKQLERDHRKVHFISNIDPDAAAYILRGLDLKKTLVSIISKTGTTLETRSNEEFVKEYFIKAGLKPERHFISITSEGSPMDDRKHYLESFYMWDWIGGRYSTTSMVGGVMLSFAFGFDVYWQLLEGAHAMDKMALTKGIETNLPLLGALLSVWNRNFLHHPTLALIPYSQALQRYPAHIQQVEMESNGKRIDQQGDPVEFETGMIIWGEPGTNAQHSFFQLLHQGTDIVPMEFIGFKESQCHEDNEFEGSTLQQKLLSNLFAQAIALATGEKSDNPNKVFLGNRPSHIILGKQLTPYALGALLGYYENKVAFEGAIWSINSFDQEGVQLGKVLAKKLIQCFIDVKSANAYPLGKIFIEQLNRL